MSLSKKRVISVVMVMLLTFGILSGCQKQGGGLQSLQEDGLATNGGEISGRYREEEITFPEGIEQVADMKVLANGDLAVFDSCGGLFTSSDMGKNWNCVNDDVIEQVESRMESIMKASIAPDGSVAILTVGVPQDKKDSEIFDYYFNVYRVDATGEFSQLSLEGREEEYISQIAYTQDGRLFGIDGTGLLYEIDCETGKCTKCCGLNEYTAYIGGGENQIYLLTESSFLFYDVTTQELKEDEAVTDFLNKTYGESGMKWIDEQGQCSFVAFPGEEGIIYLACKAGLYRHAIGGSLMEEVAAGNLSMLGDPSTMLVSGCFLEGSEFMISNDTGKVYHYFYDKDLPTVPQEELAVYSLLENETVRQAINSYRKSHPDVAITYHYGIEKDSSITIEDAMKQLSVDILSGEGPDVLLLDGLPIDSYMEKNMLLDLNPYFEEELGANQYFNNIVTCYQQDAHLYAMPAKFRTNMLFGDVDVISKITDLDSFKTALQQAREKRPEGSLIEIYSEKELLSLLEKIDSCHWLMGNNIDKDALSEYLTSAKEIYQFVNQGVTQEEKDMFGNEFMKEDNILMLLNPEAHYEVTNYFYQYLQEKTPFLAGSVSGIQWKLSVMTSTFSQLGKGDFVAWKNGNEGCFEPATIVSVCANTEKPELAVDFIKAILSGEVQAIENNDGFPVNREAMQQIFVPKDTQEDGVYGATCMSWDDNDGVQHVIDLECKALNEKEQKQFLALVDSLNTPCINDIYVRNIVLQQGCKVLAGGKSVEEAVEDIYSQLNLYLHE